MPCVNASSVSTTEMSNDSVVANNIDFAGANGIACLIPAIKFTTERCSIMTPFGFPVVPEV
ncbi:hypothetical protein D3C75_1159150 [compost metagenome]